MSVYADIRGSLVLDRPAYDALLESTTSSWISGPATVVSVNLPGGRVRLELSGSFRNLSRYLASDLMLSQLAGSVSGCVVVQCQDGGHWRSVTFFDGRTARYGDAECFHAPVFVSRAILDEIQMSGTEPLLYVTCYGQQEEAQGTFYAGSTPCACGGYDEDEYPVCANGYS